MYIINKAKNAIEPLEEVSFKAAGIRERKHLDFGLAFNLAVRWLTVMIAVMNLAGRIGVR